MGTKNDPGTFDCYAAAEPDEPLFVLLGRDTSAPFVVAFWAALRTELVDPALPASATLEKHLKIKEARACARSMENWSRALGKDRRPVQEALSRLVTNMATKPGGPLAALVAERDLLRNCLGRLFEALPEGTELDLDADTADVAADCARELRTVSAKKP